MAQLITVADNSKAFKQIHRLLFYVRALVSLNSPGKTLKSNLSLKINRGKSSVGLLEFQVYGRGPPFYRLRQCSLKDHKFTTHLPIIGLISTPTARHRIKLAHCRSCEQEVPFFCTFTCNSRYYNV